MKAHIRQCTYERHGYDMRACNYSHGLHTFLALQLKLETTPWVEVDENKKGDKTSKPMPPVDKSKVKRIFCAFGWVHFQNHSEDALPIAQEGFV